MTSAKQRWSLSGEYLERAVDALSSARDPARLYSDRRDITSLPTLPPEKRLLRDGAQYHVAEFKRRAILRSGVLFAALSGEAYINEHLCDALGSKDFEGIDRLSPIDKYVLGSRIAFGNDLFPRDNEPAQTLAKLFKRRNQLVHPKVRIIDKPSSRGPAPPDDDEGPVKVAKYILAVADAAMRLADTAFAARDRLPTGEDMHAAIITQGRKTLEQWARETEAGPMPRITEEPLCYSLWDQMFATVPPEANC